jgi:hypothetical protein
MVPKIACDSQEAMRPRKRLRTLIVTCGSRSMRSTMTIVVIHLGFHLRPMRKGPELDEVYSTARRFKRERTTRKYQRCDVVERSIQYRLVGHGFTLQPGGLYLFISCDSHLSPSLHSQHTKQLRRRRCLDRARVICHQQSSCTLLDTLNRTSGAPKARASMFVQGARHDC